MISCTEFIPAYSELFKFIDRKSGRQAVYDYWNWRFQPEHSHLYQHLVGRQLRTIHSAQLGYAGLGKQNAFAFHNNTSNHYFAFSSL